MRKQPQVIPSTALTASGATAAVALDDDVRQVTAYILVSAVSGTTPSATFTVQFSPDGTNWADATAGSAITAATNQRIAVSSNVASNVRVSYTITGTTPSFTTSIYIDAR